MRFHNINILGCTLKVFLCGTRLGNAKLQTLIGLCATSQSADSYERQFNYKENISLEQAFML